jgi:hypothetical protein
VANLGSPPARVAERRGGVGLEEEDLSGPPKVPKRLLLFCLCSSEVGVLGGVVSTFVEEEEEVEEDEEEVGVVAADMSTRKNK